MTSSPQTYCRWLHMTNHSEIVYSFHVGWRRPMYPRGSECIPDDEAIVSQRFFCNLKDVNNNICSGVQCFHSDPGKRKRSFWHCSHKICGYRAFPIQSAYKYMKWHCYHITVLKQFEQFFHSLLLHAKFWVNAPFSYQFNDCDFFNVKFSLLHQSVVTHNHSQMYRQSRMKFTPASHDYIQVTGKISYHLW